jgi:hypothetical protein
MRTRLARAAERHGIRVSTLAPHARPAGLESLLALTDAVAVCATPREQALVASVASVQDIPYVCIPAGTADLLARDLGSPLDDPAGALELVFSTNERLIDLGEVNGVIFVNYVALGADLQLPPARGADRRPDRPAAGPQRREASPLDGPTDRSTRVLVTNNRFALRRDRLGVRAWPDTGLLGIAVHRGPRHALTATPDQEAWEECACSRFELAAAAPLVANVDGVTMQLRPPLRFRCLSWALRVRAPAREVASHSDDVTAPHRGSGDRFG